MKTGLLVLDMLNDFLDGALANPPAVDLIEPIAALTESARKRDHWEVIYVGDAHHPSDFEMSVFGPHAMAGTAGAETIAQLTPQPGDIVTTKRHYSAFTQTDLDATCRTLGIDRLVLTGQHTDCCCRHTSYDAFIRGIEVVAVSDATAVYEPLVEGRYHEAQEGALKYLRTFYNTKIASSSELL